MSAACVATKPCKPLPISLMTPSLSACHACVSFTEREPGILRMLIRQYLETVPGVRHFADEHIQFGGAGITVVDLS